MRRVREFFTSTGAVDLRRRVTIGVGVIGVVVLTYAFIYQQVVGLTTPETRTYVDALQVVIETITTAGFGGDTDLWRQSRLLTTLVILMNITGVAIVFLAVPAYAVPLFRRAVGFDPPQTTGLSDHVVICGYSMMDEILSDTLEDENIPYLFIDNDEDTVERLIGDDIDAIYGNPERVSDLRNANVATARTVIADIDDETNPTVILSSNRINPDSQVISVVENPDAKVAHDIAGADHVVVSKRDLGESLGVRALETPVELVRNATDGDLDAAEYLIQGGSLVGKTLGEIEVFDDLGVTVLGGWFGARFVVSPSSSTTIEENTILLVTGNHDALTEYDTRRLPAHQNETGHTVVCGYGDVGRTATETILDNGGDPTVVDEQELPAVDVVGNITDPKVIGSLDLDTARSIVLAINDDIATIYATILINQIAPDTEIITRANDPENIWKLYNAGADYVLSLPEVAGEALAAAIIGDDIIFTPHDDFTFRRVPAGDLAGMTVVEADIRSETGCTIVGLERDAELNVDIDTTTILRADDTLLAAGNQRALDRLSAYVESDPGG